MKRQWITLVALLVMICAVLGGAGAEQLTVEAPTNVQVSATTVGKPFSVTWDGPETMDYLVSIYAADGSKVMSKYTNNQANMYYSVFRLMPGTYTVGVCADMWQDGESTFSDESMSQSFTVASSGKTWEYTVDAGKAKIVAYYGTDADVQIPATLGGYPVTKIGNSAFRCRDIRSVTLPESVAEIEQFAFYGSKLSAVTIGANVRLEEGALEFCSDELVVTGYTGSDAETEARLAGAVFNACGTLPSAPKVTWTKSEESDFADFTVYDPDATCYESRLVRTESDWENKNNNLLEIFYPGQATDYRLWLGDDYLRKEISFRALKNGAWSEWSEPCVFVNDEYTSGELDFAGAVPLSDRVMTLNVEGHNYSLIQIQPEKTELYSFASEGGYDTYAELYDAAGSMLASDDDNGEDVNFYLTQTLEAGKTYYLGVRFYERSTKGNVTIVTSCSRFTMLAAPELVVEIDEDGNYVLQLSSAEADSFRLMIKKIRERYDYWTDSVILYAENGTASYVLEFPEENSYYYEVSAIALKDSEISNWTDVVVLKESGEGSENGLQWKRTENDEITIVNYVGQDKHVVVPASINGLPVTRIGSKAFFDNDEIVTVVLPEGLREIGGRAFEDCSNLYSVQLPETLTCIEHSAFGYCYRLAVVNLPASLETVGGETFEGCSNLQWIYVPFDNDFSVPYSMFLDCPDLVIEGDSSGIVAGIAMSSGVSYSPAEEPAQPELVPEVTLEGKLLSGGVAKIYFSMPGAEEFRMLLIQDYYYLEDNYHEHIAREEKIGIDDGVAAFALEDYGDCLSYYVQATALVNGQWTAWSAPLEIIPSFYGRLSKPVPVIDGTVTAGQPFSIRWAAIENATNYSIEATEQRDDGRKYTIYSDADNEPELVWNRPAGDYLLTVYASGDVGWLTSESEPIAVHVERGECDFVYTDTGDGLLLTEYIGLSSDQTIEIPSEIKGQPVIGLGDSLLEMHPSVRTIVVPETVTRFDWGVFRYCQNLEELVFQGRVDINNFILQGCRNLTSITFADPGARVKQYVLSNLYSTEGLTIRGFTGSEIEMYAEELGISFESIGKLADCPEFTLEPEVQREGGYAYPHDVVQFTMIDPDAEEVEYRLSYVYLSNLSGTSSLDNGSIMAEDGVFKAYFSENQLVWNPMLSVRAMKDGVWSAWSEYVSLGYTMERLPKVTGVQASVVDGKCVVTWDALDEANAYIVSFAPAGQTWTMDSYAFAKTNSAVISWVKEAGSYDVYVCASESVNGDKLAGDFSDPVRVSLETDPRDRFIEVSANQGTLEIAPVNLTVFARGARQIRLYMELPNGERWVQANSWGNRLTMDINNEGTYDYVAYALWDGSETWEEIGRETVTMSYLGTLDDVTVNKPLYLLEGEDLVFSIDPVEHATEYTMSLWNQNSDSVVLHQNILPGEEIVIPAEYITGQHARINLVADAIGYPKSEMSFIVPVMPRTEHQDVSLSVKDTELLLDDQVELTVTAPGATCVLVYRNGSSYTYIRLSSEDGDTFTMYADTSGLGEKTFFVRCYYGDTADLNPWDETQYDGPSNAVTVNVTSLGNAPMPEVSAHMPTEDDPFLRLELAPTGVADYYQVELVEGNNCSIIRVLSVDPENPMATLTASYPASILREGAVYTADVASYRTHYQLTSGSVNDFSYVCPGEEPERYFRVSSNEGIYQVSPVEIALHAAGANGLRLSYMYAGNDEIYEYTTSWNTEILRYTCTDICNNMVYIGYATWDGGETWEEIGRETVSISYLGELDQVTVDVPPYVRAGEEFVFSFDPVEHATGYSMTVRDHNWDIIVPNHTVRPGEEIVIPAQQATNPVVQIVLYAQAAGYQPSGNTVTVPVMPQTEHQDVSLSVKNTEIFLGEEAELTVTAPGATCVLVYRNGSSYTYFTRSSEDGDTFTMHTNISGLGEKTFFVRCYYGDTADLNPWDATQYDGPSNVVTVNVISLGDVPAPEVSVHMPTEDDPFLRFEVVPTDVADYYRIDLMERDGYTISRYLYVDPENPMATLTASYPVNVLREGHTYTAGVASCRTHYESTFESVNDFSYVCPGEEPERYFRVSSNEGVCQVTPVDIVLHAAGADGLRLSYMYAGNDEINEYTTSWNTEILRYTCADFCTNMVYIGYATWDDGETWEEIGRETVSISYLGELDQVTVDVPPYVRAGEDIVFSFDPVEHATGYSMTVRDHNWNIIIPNHTVRPGEEIVIPAQQATNPVVQIVFYAQAAGYQSSDNTVTVPIMPQTEHQDVSLSVKNTEIFLDDQVELTVTAPGATCVLVYRNGSSCTYDMRSSEDGDTFTMYAGTSGSGEKTFFVRCYYGDTADLNPWDETQYDGPSNAVTVNVISLGDVPAPEVSVHMPTEDDPFLRFEVVPTGVADYYQIDLLERDGYSIYRNLYVDPENPMETLTASYSASILREGCTYTANISCYRTHYESTFESVNDFSYVCPGEEPERYFRVSSNEGIYQVSPVEIALHAAGANGLRLSYMYAGNDEIYEYTTSWNTEILRYTCTDICNNMVYIGYVTWDDGETWEEIGRETINITYLDNLADVKVHVEPYLRAGEDLVFIAEPVEHARNYHICVVSEDSGEIVYQAGSRSVGEPITIPASQLTDKRYRIDASAYATGYCSSWRYYCLEILPEPNHKIAFSVDQDYVLTGTGINLTVDASGATGIWMYKDGESYSQQLYFGEPLTEPLTYHMSSWYSNGEHSLYVRAYYGDPSEYYTTDQRDGLSNVVFVTYYSYGKAALPKIDVPSSVSDGEPISIVLTPDGYAEKYIVKLQQVFDDGETTRRDVKEWNIHLKDATRDTPVTLTYPSDTMIPGKQYSVYLCATAKGYDSSDRYLENENHYIVKEQSESSEVTLTFDCETAYVYDTINALIYDPEATDMQLRTDDETSIYWNPVRCLDGYWSTSFSINESGSNTISAWAYKGGEWVKVAERTVTITEKPLLPIENITVSNVVMKGDTITVKISPVENADYYAVTLCDQYGYQLEYVEADSAEIQISTKNVTGDGIYKVSACANAWGYQSLWCNEIPVMVTSGMQRLNLPKGTVTIEDEAFAETGVEYVVLPDSVTSIGSRAFANCGNLKVIEIPASVINIAGDVFDGCGRLMVITDKECAAYNQFAGCFDVAVFAD